MQKRMVFFCLSLVAICTHIMHPLKIDRAIVASDNNPMYIQFWSLVAKAWKKLDVQPTLILIAQEDVQVDESLGDVIRLAPIPGVPTATYAQVVRLLAPAYFENEVCIISDMDMIPLSKDYFLKSIEEVPNDHFVVYRDTAYGDDYKRYPMCYNAGKGSLFKSIFKLKNVAAIPEKVKSWTLGKKLQGQNWGWHTDEIALYYFLGHWKHFKSKCTLLGCKETNFNRIDRSDWNYDPKKLGENYYVDAHMLRPLNEHFAAIKKLADDLGIEIW